MNGMSLTATYTSLHFIVKEVQVVENDIVVGT